MTSLSLVDQLWPTLKEYNPDQPRDEQGRFGSGGGSSSSSQNGGGSSNSVDSEVLTSGNSKATRGEVNRLHKAAQAWQSENNYTTPPNASDIIKAGVTHGGFTKQDAIRIYSVYRDHKPK